MADAASSILLRAGVLGPQSLAAATALKQREGGTLGEALVRLGLVDEERLVAVFQEGLLVPVIGDKELQRVPKAVLDAVPARMAAEYRVIPVEIDAEGNLALAMADPTDNRAVDAIAAHTGRFVMRAVAAPTAVRTALLSLYGVSLTARGTPPSGDEGRQPQPSGRSDLLPPSEQVVPAASLPAERPPQSVLMALQRAVDPGEQKGRKTRNSQKLPALVVDSGAPAPRNSRSPRRSKPAGGKDEAVVLDKPKSATGTTPPGASPTGSTLPGLGSAPAGELLAPVARLRAAADRDEIVTVLLDYASRLAARVGLFVVQKGQLACLDGRGPDHVVVAMKWFTIPVDTPSPFRDVLESRAPYIGTLGDTAESRAFRSALGSTEKDLLLLPLLVGDRAVGVLYADEIKEDLGKLSRELETLSREAGAAFARIILSAKKKK